MLSLCDTNKKLLHQWPIITPHSKTDIEFIVHCSNILSHHSDESCITIFYGFLDQDYQESAPAACVAKLLKKDGIDALNNCYGSFIVLHYNTQKNELLLANDALGDFAAHYYQSDDKIIISDLPEPLLNKDNGSINESRVLHFFAHTKPQTNGCFFSELKQLNPGTGVIFKPVGIQLKQYYYPSEQVNIKSGSIPHLIEEFSSLMQSAISYQTQGQKKIAVMMSGGMDSTFVAGNALKINKKVSSFSYVFPNLPETDESRWIDAFRGSKLDMHTFSGEPYWPLKSPVYVSINSPILNPYRGMKDVIYNSTHNKNIKYLLTGVFADHLYAGYIYWLVDQIKVNPLKGLFSLIKLSKDLGVKNGLRQISPLKWRNKSPLKAPWMNPQALKLLQDNRAKTLGNKHPHPQQWALTFGIATAQGNWLENEYAFKHNILLRHPFRDRRVVEFLMALPAYVLGTVKNTKAFARAASTDILPDAIIRRTTITTLEPMFTRSVLNKEKAKVTELLTQSDCTWQHYIDKKIIESLLKNPDRKHKESHLLTLWQCIGFELWQRRIAQIPI